ncbi:hypothetical protein QVD17_31673 [Tagetes erecta]|uniref:TIR domain-containing protein n=1 Tax=Tagetes erecta TaxID=13708 RepID=A0AAD8KAB1_TARER|nr:hypothetical protein QVD17_31673 [Tagetes erecta]
MASSSSSSRHLMPTSISQSWKYDVFLSFRGEDTRKNFVGHLYAALVQQGIHTYKDDETLPRGDSIDASLKKAIQESQVAVIVFSENYADSSWCLDELTHIMYCKDKRQQIVMPVFYNIDPSQVRKQNGTYGEALAKHELNNKPRVELWKQALVTAGKISGWVSKDFANGHEQKCIKDIIGAISSKLSLTPFTNVNKNLIGIETRLQDLKSKIGIGSGGVRMVGIRGDGGGGKTTLAHAAYSEISHEFEATCFLENVRDESSKQHGLKRLQEKILSSILNTKLKLQSEMEGKSMIKRKLCHKSVLIVLDDVDDRKQLEALAGSHDWFGEGSRIIITTRDEHLLTHKADMIYKVSLLSHDEAVKLFKRHAYREEKPVEDYETLSLEVVSYCAGLPLALEVLGSFLYDKEKDEWMGLLAKLKCIPNPTIIERLKISYDGLEPNEKELFLDIACFLRKWDINKAMMLLDACSYYPKIGVRVLIQKSLIKVSNEKIDMHDLIEEMARYIVKEEYPKKHSRIWKKQDLIDLCTKGATPSLMETEVLHLQGSDYQQPHLSDIVVNMNKPRWIYLKFNHTSAFQPSNFEPTNLRFLTLMGFGNKQLWKGYKHLPKLKILDLSNSGKLRRTPDFSGLPCLERLNLNFCSKLKEIHPSIGSHESLVWVSLNRCKKLKTFPPIIRMKKLETLILSWCERLRKFPLIQSNMDSLECLHLDWSGIEMIPPTVGQLCTNLVTFNLSYCSNLRRIQGNFRLLKRLKYLHLHNCFELEKFDEDFFYDDSSLEVLNVNVSIRNQASTPLKNLMNRMGLPWFHQDKSINQKLSQLPRCITKLSLYNCNLEDGDMMGYISELVTLQVLDLSYNKFSRLHSSLSQIPCLKFLNLSDCENLVELPDLPSSIAILIADYCGSLERVGNLSKYKWLWKVSVQGSDKLISGELVLNSMLQVNAFEDRFMSVLLPRGSRHEDIRSTLVRVQLPNNWHSDFSGFIFLVHNTYRVEIVIKGEMSQGDDHHMKEVDDENWAESSDNEYRRQVGYVPFASLRHTSWWNSNYTNLSFHINSLKIFHTPLFKVKLVPNKSRTRDSREVTKDFSQNWDKENKYHKTFEIIDDDSNSSTIKILWKHF